jgi:hypothetical protein
MMRAWKVSACVVLTALTVSACSNREATPTNPAADHAAAGADLQPDADHGDDEPNPVADPVPADPAASLKKPPASSLDAPDVSLPATKGANDQGAAPPQPAEEPDPEPPTPSLFRSLGRAVGRGLRDAVGNPRPGEAAAPPADPAQPSSEPPQP